MCQIWWKYFLRVIQFQTIISQKALTHITTAKLSWHIQHFVAIPMFTTWILNESRVEIPFDIGFAWKIISVMDLDLFPVSYLTTVQARLVISRNPCPNGYSTNISVISLHHTAPLYYFITQCLYHNQAWDKMVGILQTRFSNEFSCVKFVVIYFRFHQFPWPRANKYCFDMEQVTKQYLKKWLSSVLMPICII